MLVQNDAKMPVLPQMDSASQPIKEGGSYHAAVKERLPNNEAIVQVKGQEMRVKVDGKIPDGGKMTMQVTDGKQDPPVVKLTPAPQAPAETAKAQGGPALSDDMKDAIKLLNGQNVPITKENLQAIKNYMDKAPGTPEQKLETLARMAAKGLEFTPEQIRAVDEALHGEKLGKVLEDIAGKVEPARPESPAADKALRELLSKLEKAFPDKAEVFARFVKMIDNGQKPSDIAKVLLSQFSNELKTEPGLAKEAAMIAASDDPINIKLPSTNTDIPQKAMPSIKDDLMKMVQKVPEFAKVVGAVKEAAASMPDGGKLAEAAEKAEILQKTGREMAARAELASAINELPEPEKAKAAASDAETQYRLNSDVLAAVPIGSRDLVVTTITKKLSQAAIDFKAVKQEISHALQMAQNLIKQAPVSAKQPLEAAIKQLDQAILKSDFMLYTDMGTEKKLLVASSQLQDARKLLAKGEHAKAYEIVSAVRETVDKLIFKPSDVRVKHFVAKEFLQPEQPSLSRQIAETVERPLELIRHEPTARQALDYIRRLGLTHETDAAHRILSGDMPKGERDATLKNMLLKLAQAEGQQATGARAEQAAMNMTGQQLLSKPEASGLQTMLFTLPLILQDQAADVKVFLKSNNGGQKIDWENCSLYFLLETKKMGDVGIMLTAADRNLSVILKNDQPGFKERMAPLTDVAKSRLEEIGYSIGKIQFTSLTVNEPKETKPAPAPKKAFSERGYDFTI